MNKPESLTKNMEKVRARLKTAHGPVMHNDLIKAGYTEEGFADLMKKTLDDINEVEQLTPELHINIREFLTELYTDGILPTSSAWPRRYFVEKAYYRSWEEPRERFIFKALDSLFRREMGYKEKGCKDSRAEQTMKEVDRRFKAFKTVKSSLKIFNQPEADDNANALDLARLFLRLFYVEGLAAEILGAWKTYEEFIYMSKPYYRDHFLHLMYNFLMGCKLMDEFADRIKENWKYYTGKTDIGDDEYRVRQMRSWLAAAFFHDIGYSAEALKNFRKSLQDTFFSKIPGLDLNKLNLDKSDYLKDEISDFLDMLAFVLDEDEFSFTFERLSEFKEKYPDHLMYGAAKALFSDCFDTMDHGIMSALFLLIVLKIDIHEFTMYHGDGAPEKYEERHEKYREKRNELLEDIVAGAFAIAIHNIRINTFDGLTIDFRSHPITFFLMLSDDLQEYDRGHGGRSNIPDLFRAIYGFEVRKRLKEIRELFESQFFSSTLTKRITSLDEPGRNCLNSLVQELKSIISARAASADTHELKRILKGHVDGSNASDEVKEILKALFLVLTEDVITITYIGGEDEKNRVRRFWETLKNLFTKNLSYGPSICVLHGYDEEHVKIFFTAEWDEAFRCYRVDENLKPKKEKGDKNHGK